MSVYTIYWGLADVVGENLANYSLSRWARDFLSFLVFVC